jgi:hypothetical protein
MYSLFEIINVVIGNIPFLLLTKLAFFACKLYLTVILASYGLRSTVSKKLFIFLIIFLVGRLLEDITLIMIFMRRLLHLEQESKIVVFIARISWALFITQYQSIGFFLDHLVTKKFSYRKLDGLFLTINIVLSSCFLYLAFLKFNVLSDNPETYGFESKLVSVVYICLFLLLTPVLYRTSKKIYSHRLPKILTHQLKIIVYFLLIPHVLLEYMSNQHSLLYFINNLFP